MFRRFIQPILAFLERQPAILIDSIIALGAFVPGALTLVDRAVTPADRPITTTTWLLAIAIAAPICLRRRFPLGSPLAIVALALVYQWHLSPNLLEAPQFVPVLVGLYGVAAWDHRRRSMIPAALAASLLFLIDADFSPGDPQLVSNLSTVVLALVLGALFYGRRARARDAERARQEEATRLVQDERIRIARELHDVLAHSIAAITIQAGMAQHVFDSNPDRAREAVREIRDLSKHALIELRGTLGLLRSSSETPVERGPMPGLQQLGGLIATAEAAGIHTRFTIVGPSRPLPPTIDLTLYRVLQEALTNIVRHAGRDADATIAIAYLPDAIQIVVTDRGPASPQSHSPYTGGSGLGLLGMHERVEAAGGSMVAGPRLGSGFELKVSIPTGMQP